MPFVGSYLWELRQHVGTMAVLVPGACVLAQDDEGRILLIERSDMGTWCLPSGGAERGSSFVSTAVTELREETGLIADPADLVPYGCLSDPQIHLITYPNGDVTHAFTLCFALRRWSGALLEETDEATAIRFCAPDALPAGLMRPSAHAIEMYRRFRETGEFQLS